MKSRAERYNFRSLRTRGRIKLSNTNGLPRLSVYRSLKHIYAQIIDDVQGKTLVAASTAEEKLTDKSGIPAATAVGEALGQRAKEKGISSVVFDRGARPYHGRVKALADGARQAGLKF